MAYKSKFTGSQVDSLLDRINDYPATPSEILDGLTAQKVLDLLTGQQIIDKINSVTGNIVFTKYVDCQAGAGKSTN